MPWSLHDHSVGSSTVLFTLHISNNMTFCLVFGILGIFCDLHTTWLISNRGSDSTGSFTRRIPRWVCLVSKLVRKTHVRQDFLSKMDGPEEWAVQVVCVLICSHVAVVVTLNVVSGCCSVVLPSLFLDSSSSTPAHVHWYLLWLVAWLSNMTRYLACLFCFGPTHSDWGPSERRFANPNFALLASGKSGQQSCSVNSIYLWYNGMFPFSLRLRWCNQMSRPHVSRQHRAHVTTAFMLQHWSDCLFWFCLVQVFQSVKRQWSSQVFCAVCSFHLICVSISDHFVASVSAALLTRSTYTWLVTLVCRGRS